MSWFLGALELYLFACLVVVHLSLLFCKPDHCAFDATPALQAIPPNVSSMITKILAAVPISLQNLQLLAHFLLIGDVLLLLGVTCRLLGSVLRYVLSTLILTLTISFVIYVLANSQDSSAFNDAKSYMGSIWSKLKTGSDL